MTTDQNSSDDWVRRLSSNGAEREDAIEELTRLLVRGLSKSMSNRYGNAVQPDDVVQEAMLKILDSLDTFAGRSRFTTWAMTIATRVAISEMRRKHYQDVSLDSITSGENLSFEIAAGPSMRDEEQIDRAKVLSTLHQLIESELSVKQREAIQALLSGLPVEEIASRTGSNRNAVYKLIHDARVRLKSGLERSGLMADDFNAIFA
ncbi:RNA polymerase sigma-70 factor (ECF subfamily) [Rhodopirellula rubra]|uniref:RNA polymerase sigma-70 factor (ECF subfamily) n=1 Tax=Aporhodopirellula rubra TaxID=980271 RepID=A0A7W5H613_9BACT|nr:RNA polymerase sigma factor [Aporhodopirellula rubra]MBB3206813.1 RNA polymerase sigma-70 factor (ECF subfamily) [Aporhodopirellula rubra]